MNEMELLTRFRDEVPANVNPARAEAALLTAIKAGETPAAAQETRRAQEGRRALGLTALRLPDVRLAERARAAWGTGAPRRRWARNAWRLSLVGGAGLALAAGVFAAQAILPGGTHPATGLTVRELAYRTSAAAAAQPNVRPGQWVYWQEKQFGGKPDGIFQVWTTADSTKAAYVYRGKVHLIKFTAPVMRDGKVVLRHGRPVMKPGGQSIGQPAIFVAPYGGVTTSGVSGRVPICYADLGSLPSSPLALNRYLSGLDLPGWGPAPVREFEIIKDLLTTYVMPPALTAELYQALGDIPGVTVDQHAVDVAGRHGIGFRVALPRSASGGFDEIIINPRSYLLMGQQLIANWPGSRGKVLGGTAILRMALVSGPGKQP